MLETSTIRTEPFAEIGRIIERDAEVIVNLWAVESRRQRPEAQSQHWDVLKNSLPKFLKAVADSLAERSGEEEEEHAEVAEEHGQQRWETGWNLSDLVSDYQLLRLIVLEHVERERGCPPTFNERSAINLYIDDAISAAVTSFVEHESAQLEQARNRLNEFLSILGHELRNPLNGIAMGLQLIPHEQSAERRNTEAMMAQQVALMSRLVDDMLDLSRIARKQLSLVKGRVDLNAILKQAVQAVRSSHQKSEHRFEIALTPHAIWIDADGTRLLQVFSNLLSNAVKYTPPGGTIALKVDLAAEGRVVVRICDNGQGIDALILPHIFDLYVQSPENVGRGLGVGLALAKALVELHGGLISVHSAGLGLGSEFTVSLPLGANEAEQPDAPLRAASSASSNRTQPCRVLVVDDVEPAARALAALLRQRGHSTWTAVDGEQAIQVALAERPDVVLIDIGLPKLNGYEVATLLRATPEFQNTLFVAMTGYTDTPRRDQSQQAGIDHHFVKPVDVGAIDALIAEHRTRSSSGPNADPDATV